jgi:hypothetical protein
MIIANVDGSVIDTDKLPDMEAEITETAHKLQKLCEAARTPMFLTFERQTKGALQFWNFRTKENQTGLDASIAFDTVFRAVHMFIQNTTDKKLGIALIKPPDNE